MAKAAKPAGRNLVLCCDANQRFHAIGDRVSLGDWGVTARHARVKTILRNLGGGDGGRWARIQRIR